VIDVIYGVRIQSITAKSVGSVIKSLLKNENTVPIVICVLKRVMATLPSRITDVRKKRQPKEKSVVYVWKNYTME